MTIDAPRAEQLPALRSLWQQAFGDTDAFLDLFFSTAYAQDHCRCIGEGVRVYAALYWLDCTCRDRRFAYLYAIATDASLRGQGLCHRLMEDTHRHLRAQDYAGALLVPATPSLFSLYRNMDYTAELPCHTFSCAATEATLPWRRIGAQEYAALRAQYLPNEALLWSQAAMDFLAATHTLCCGAGFLAAVRREGESLHCAELLGDTAIAPTLAHAFGATQITARTVGSTTPFALYHPLTDAPPPTSFTLAFD